MLQALKRNGTERKRQRLFGRYCTTQNFTSRKKLIRKFIRNQTTLGNYYSHFIRIERNFEIRYRGAKGHAEEKMVEHFKGSSERLTKLILSVKKVDEQARVKDSWHIVCTCEQQALYNGECTC